MPASEVISTPAPSAPQDRSAGEMDRPEGASAAGREARATDRELASADGRSEAPLSPVDVGALSPACHSPPPPSSPPVVPSSRITAPAELVGGELAPKQLLEGSLGKEPTPER